MSHQDPSSEQLVYRDFADDHDPAPEQQGLQHETSLGADEVAPLGPDDEYLDDEDDWVHEGPQKGVRLRVPTGVLLLLLFAAGGLWLGSYLQKHHDRSKGTSAASALASALAARRGGTTGNGTTTRNGTTSGGAAAGIGRSGGGTVGIVTTVEGSTVYLTDANGNLVKIVTTPSSTITKSDPGTLADLKPGQTVIVSGTKAPDGSTTARSITVSPAGGAFGGATGAPAGGGAFGGATGAPAGGGGG